MKRLATLGLLMTLLLGGGLVSAAPPAKEVAVTIQDFAYDPASVTISAGDTVTWTNNDSAPHTATGSDNSWDSGRLDQGGTFSQTFSTAGTFDYICTFHPNMKGTVIVEGTTDEPTAAPQPTTAPAADAPTGTLSASDQPIVDGSITVSSATISQDGWIIVHKFDADGKPVISPPVGKIQLTAGSASTIRIPLTESFNAGDKLMPMLHIDAGTMGTYEFPDGPDVPVTANGSAVVATFTVQAAGAPGNLPGSGAGDSLPLLPLAALALLLIAGALVLRRKTA